MTRIALVLGGHASLGAYTAGAASELLRALEDDRRSAAEVAVVTGSGTGGLTAALVARSLVVNPGLRPWLERLWLDALDARHLLDPDRPDPSSLLDPAPLEELTLHMIAGEPAEDDRPSAVLGETLRLGLSLVPLRDGAGPRGTREPDGACAALFDLEASREAGDPVWEHVRRAALAAAAVPPALPPRHLGPDDGAEPGDGWYAGAGGSRPRPLALARRLIRESSRAGGEQWRVVVVEPEPSLAPGVAPSAPAPDAGRPPRSAGAAAEALLGAGLGAEVARDWRAARDAVGRMELLRSLASRLPEIHGRLDDPDAVGLGRHIGRLAEEVAEREAGRRGAPPDAPGDPVLRRLDAGLRRIAEHPAYAPAFSELDSRAGRTRLAKLIYVLEAASGLLGEEPSRLHMVSPAEPGGLAGRRLGGFGGFACRAWRHHDLVAGRRDARRVLEGPLEDLVASRPREEEAYEPPPVQAAPAALDAGSLHRLRDRLGSEADRALGELAPGGLRGLFFRLSRPGARERLVDRAMAALDPTTG